LNGELLTPIRPDQKLGSEDQTKDGAKPKTFTQEDLELAEASSLLASFQKSAESYVKDKARPTEAEEGSDGDETGPKRSSLYLLLN